MEGLLRFNEWLSGVVWGWPMLLLLTLAGVVFTVRTRFVQLRRFRDMLRLTLGAFTRRKNVAPGEVSPLQAMTTALAATVGTGNIAGVAGAIALGGPGAVFWMWVSAFLGMATKYAEVVLAVRYRQRAADGTFCGGPMYYIRALGRGFASLARLFALLGALAAFGIGNMVQANTAAEAAAFSLTAFFPALPGAPLRLFVGIILSLAVALALMGGAARIGRATERLVPLMSALYACMALSVVFLHLPAAARALGDIVTSALSPRAGFGGAAGIGIQAALRCGMERGMFSHEAGMGSAPIAHAGAKTDDPDRQGLFGIFEVFADTIVICTLTALVILCSGTPVPYGSEAGAELTISGFTTTYGSWVSLFTMVALCCFAFSTIIGWGLYGSTCISYLCRTEKVIRPFLVVYSFVAILGATMDLGLLWSIADTFNGLMAIPNLIALLLLSGTVVRLVREFFAGEGEAAPANGK